MKVRKDVYLDEKVIKKAEKKAEELGLNFSAYITYLINKDCKKK